MAGNIDILDGGTVDASATLHMLLDTVSRLSLARSLEEIQAIVTSSARALLNADGATFVLRDLDHCHYLDEDAIAPLWKGQRFPLSACISGWVMVNRRPVAIEDVYEDDRTLRDAYRPTFVRSMVMVPVRSADPIAAVGVYWATSHVAGQDEVNLAQALADSVAVALEHVRVLDELERTVELSSTDPLTGVANRRAWDRALGLALDRFPQLTLGMIDLDHFKHYNDANGHLAGDELLKDCAVVWRGALREVDLLARYGGEEFCVLLRGIEPDQAVTVAERVRVATPGGITASVGVAHARPGEHATSLMARADSALYQAKRGGRDRLVVAD